MKMRTLSKTGRLQTEYRKRGFFLTARPGGRFIISKEGNPLAGNLKRFSLDAVSDVPANIALWHEFANQAK